MSSSLTVSVVCSLGVMVARLVRIHEVRFKSGRELWSSYRCERPVKFGTPIAPQVVVPVVVDFGVVVVIASLCIRGKNAQHATAEIAEHETSTVNHERKRSNVPAKSPLEVIETRFVEFGFPLVVDQNIIPNSDDRSTLFMCSGMQRVKSKFQLQDKTHYGSIQSCIRTNDLSLIGDGTHLTSFQMVGNFSFGNCDYEKSVELWHCIVRDLGLPISEIRVHPNREDHKSLWLRRGYNVVNDRRCEWSDGNIGGHCCEMYCEDLEVGNLVNPLGHSTDVGFGLERIYQVLERKCRVDETSLFDCSLDPISRDIVRTLLLMKQCGVKPGSKGRESICRQLLRRVLHTNHSELSEWIENEKMVQQQTLLRVRKHFRRNRDKSPQWWMETFGVQSDDLRLLQREQL